ncbi:hypothetical protein HELRODRAFT_65623, partial [Helobdella robusta]|uniref:Uncharacterized protein n=1 Tax=Helobdella robusta TaxID=6412 RepID=T1FYA8_HELRO
MNVCLVSLRKFMLFPVVGLLVLLAGECCCVMSQCDAQKSTLTLVSGILYVVGGLFVLIGIVIFIGAVTEEAGNSNKPRVTSEDQSRLLYHYGPSFILTILSFITSEFTGVLSVYLYI